HGGRAGPGSVRRPGRAVHVGTHESAYTWRRGSGQPRMRFGGQIRGSRDGDGAALGVGRSAMTGKMRRKGTDMKHKLEIATGSRRRSGPFAPIEEAIEAIRSGAMVIVVDDPDRENEGDLTIAAEKITPDAINFMARYGRGLICMSLTP